MHPGEQLLADGISGLGGSGRVCGGRRKYVRVGLVAASMRLTPPQTRPDPPFDSVSLPWEKRRTAVGRQLASIWVMRNRTLIRSRRLFGNQPYRRDARPTVGIPRFPWPPANCRRVGGGGFAGP